MPDPGPPSAYKTCGWLFVSPFRAGVRLVRAIGPKPQGNGPVAARGGGVDVGAAGNFYAVVLAVQFQHDAALGIVNPFAAGQEADVARPGGVGDETIVDLVPRRQPEPTLHAVGQGALHQQPADEVLFPLLAHEDRHLPACRFAPARGGRHAQQVLPRLRVAVRDPVSRAPCAVAEIPLDGADRTGRAVLLGNREGTLSATSRNWATPAGKKPGRRGPPCGPACRSR